MIHENPSMPHTARNGSETGTENTNCENTNALTGTELGERQGRAFVEGLYYTRLYAR
jgi:hypothetical protein